MVVVIPYGSRDGDLVLELLDHIYWLGPLANHQCHLIHQPDGLPWRERAIASATRTFGLVSAEALETNVAGWPQAGNHLFSAAARAMLRQPWFFFEPDCTPMRTGWLDLLQDELAASGKACLGAVVPTRYVDRTTGLETVMDQHMVGAGVYPANVPSGSLLFKDLHRCGQPWDIWMQHELTPHCQATASIQHIWNVVNCRRENGEILCDAGSPISRPEPIFEAALVVHGVKDGSLLRLLQTEARAPEPVPIEVAETPPSFCGLGDDSDQVLEADVSGSGQKFSRKPRGRLIARDPKIMARLAAEAAYG